VVGSLPHGYREYMTALGVGTYCDLMQVLTPAQIREARDKQPEFLQYLLPFWHQSEELTLALEEAIAGVYFASTDNGDRIYYLPTQERLVAVTGHFDAVFWLENGFADPLDWRSSSPETFHTPPPFRYFEPSVGDQHIIEFFTAGTFDMRALANRFRAQWSSQEVRSIPGAQSFLLFPRVLQGHVLFTQVTGDPRVGIRVSYDNDRSTEVERFASELRDMGFFETWRYPITEPGAATHP
jgi:hypothetical protein